MRERLLDLVSPLVAAAGLELWDVEIAREAGRTVVRVLIDRSDGVTDEDCRRVSGVISTALDEADPLPEAYVLEVGSPGVDRKLRHRGDFDRFAGQPLRLLLRRPVAGRSVLEGLLLGVEGETVRVQVGREAIAVPLVDVREARLQFAGFGARRERGRDGQPAASQ